MNDITIESILEDDECPFINAFFLENGELLALESLLAGANQRIRVLCKSTITSFFEYNDEDYVISFDFQKEYENDKYIISGGEGSFGGDGVLCVRYKDTMKLVWFLFLDNSNPFDTIDVENECVLVKSTSNVSFKIPISHPEMITLV